MSIRGNCEREMTGMRQVLLELICYASDRGKPAILNVRPERITELSMRGLIEQCEDGYRITKLGREQCPRQEVPEQDLRSPTKAGNMWQVHGIPPRQALARATSGSRGASQRICRLSGAGWSS